MDAVFLTRREIVGKTGENRKVMGLFHHRRDNDGKQTLDLNLEELSNASFNDLLNMTIMSEMDEETGIREEDNGEERNTEEPRIKVGCHVAVSHGRNVFPAVITKIQDGSIWIKYFKDHNKNRWSLEDEIFTVSNLDLTKLLETPDIIYEEGKSRFFYKFHDL